MSTLRIPADDHVKRERYLSELEAMWGPAPGKQQSDGSSIFVLGEQFGNVFVGVQPAFGYEGDPMRLLFEKGFAPTHAFTAFYRWISEDFGADAVLHFGTHGALEFMPGKQAGLSAACWPDRLIGDLPNLYLYASNNPSEGTLAKRRGNATLISYLTPPIAHAGLYRGLLDLKGSIERWRQLPPEAAAERRELAVLIQAQAATVDLAQAEPAWEEAEVAARILALNTAVLELEYTLIPHGLHVVGEPATPAERVDLLLSVAEATHGLRPSKDSIEALVEGAPADQALAMSGLAHDEATLKVFRELAETDRLLAKDHEIEAVLRALDGRFVPPAPGGDLLRTPAILPTGRNLHGFDPFRIPSAFAIKDGAHQAARLLARYVEDGNPFPESIALVLWGTDNLKTEGGPIAQALALIGAKPRFDNYGRLCGRDADPAGRARPAARRRGDDAVGHLPRPVAVADQAAGRGVLSRRHRRGAGGAELRAQARAGLSEGQRLRPRDRGAARVLQRRRRLRLERQPAHRQQPLGGRGRAGRDLYPPQVLRLWPHRRRGAPARAAAPACCPTSSSPTRTWNRSNSASPPSTTISIRWAASAAR